MQGLSEELVLTSLHTALSTFWTRQMCLCAVGASARCSPAGVINGPCYIVCSTLSGSLKLSKSRLEMVTRVN